MPTSIANSGIAQTAFDFLEHRPLSSLAGTSAKVVSAARAYDRALRMGLEMADWSFARELADLSAVDVAQSGYLADDNLPYGYVLPPDCVKIRRVVPSYIDWRADKLYFRSNQDTSIRITYTAMITDEAKLPQTFQALVAYRMALLMPQLIKSQSKLQRLRGEAHEARIEALDADRGAQSPEKTDDDQFGDDWASEAVR